MNFCPWRSDSLWLEALLCTAAGFRHQLNLYRNQHIQFWEFREPFLVFFFISYYYNYSFLIFLFVTLVTFVHLSSIYLILSSAFYFVHSHCAFDIQLFPSPCKLPVKSCRYILMRSAIWSKMHGIMYQRKKKDN